MQVAQLQPPAKAFKNACRVSLLGEKVQRPLMNICRKCNCPIIQHGRFIPCKHVMCVTCAASITSQECPICGQSFTKIEQNNVVFICPFLTADNKSCERSYLSERDLVAHLKIRHAEIDVEKFSAGKPLVLPKRESYAEMEVPAFDPLPPPPVTDSQPIGAIGQDVDLRQMNDPGFRGQFFNNYPRGFNATGGSPYSRPHFPGSPNRAPFRHRYNSFNQRGRF